jgi:hypothetical protein
VNDLDLAALGTGHTAQTFWARSEHRPQVTLILRDDRQWLGAPSLLLAPARRLLPRRALRALHDRRQRRQFAEVAARLRRELPEVRVIAVGLGRAGGLPDEVQDLRRPAPTPDEELAWLAEYARSQVVLGVHGSNMLLPSALAGAVVDLLPASKLRNITQDLIIAGASEREPKLCLFRYRILPETTAPRAVAQTMLSILADAEFHHRNTIENRAAHGAVGWTRPISWRRLVVGSPQSGS